MEMTPSVISKNRNLIFPQQPPMTRNFLRFPTLLGALLSVWLMTCFTPFTWGEEIDLEAIGIRGGINFNDIGIPPTEKEDFSQYDVFAVVNLPWRWEYPSGWEIHSRLTTSLGAIQGGGDTGFITTVTPGLAFYKPSWRFTLDLGAGGALLSDYKYGRQNIGGPFQFIAHGGLLFDLGWNLVGGYRFHHMSDADIYGNNRGVDLHMIEFSYHFGND